MISGLGGGSPGLGAVCCIGRGTRLMCGKLHFYCASANQLRWRTCSAVLRPASATARGQQEIKETQTRQANSGAEDNSVIGKAARRLGTAAPLHCCRSLNFKLTLALSRTPVEQAPPWPSRKAARRVCLRTGTHWYSAARWTASLAARRPARATASSWRTGRRKSSPGACTTRCLCSVCGALDGRAFQRLPGQCYQQGWFPSAAGLCRDCGAGEATGDTANKRCLRWIVACRLRQEIRLLGTPGT